MRERACRGRARRSGNILKFEQMDPLQQAWQDMPASRTSPAEFRGMIQQHPARRGMRRQMIFEMISLIVFLIVYYDFFDGARRSAISNVLLVSAVGLVILHNAAGYFFSRRVLEGAHLQEMVGGYLSAMRRFAVISVGARVGMVVCMLLFFCSGMVMAGGKIWMIIVVGLIAAGQMIWLGSIWRRRIRDIRATLADE